MSTLEERRQANIGAQVDNAKLPAGAQMYYYCHCCGTETALLPEDWYQEPPPKFCKDCLALPEDERTSYNNWLRRHGHKLMPR